MMTKNKRHDTMMMTAGLLLCSLVSADALALDPQPLPVTKGVYRLPFPDGTTVKFQNDYTNHPAALNRVDMTAEGPGSGPFYVVAAAGGWIRLIVEDNNTKCPDFTNDLNGDGVVTTTENDQAQANACGNYNGPSTFCCEADYEANGGTCPSVGGQSGTCLNGPNNFVWIEHPNGEWSKYTHMLKGSVGTGLDLNGNPGAGHQVDDWVNAGEVLGIEADVGFASGVHVHFEVAIPNYVEFDPDNASFADPDRLPPEPGDYFSDGFLHGDGIQDDVLFEDPDGNGVNNPDDDVNRQNRISVFCQVGFPVDNAQNTAVPCDDACQNATLDFVGTFQPGDTPLYEQVSDTMGNDTGDLTIASNAGVSIRAGNSITLSPGFHAEVGSYFTASIGACDSPGGTGD